MKHHSTLEVCKNAYFVTIHEHEQASVKPDYSVSLVENVIRRYSEERSVPVIWVAHDELQLNRVSDIKMSMNEKKLDQYI